MQTITREKPLVVCQYCKREAQKVGGKEIYPHRRDLYEKLFWLCQPCDAYAGHIHDNVMLANKDLRQARKIAHENFDMLWISKKYQRKILYKMLANYMKLDKDNCHIALFNIEQCKKVLEFVSEITKGNNETI